MASRSHLSIGEVLSLLQEEFPDVTISKIRFLESQGLVDPERTPSGYRKFYEDDIDRLRWVLRQQRDAFLPLKVIKGRLEGQADQLGPEEEPDAPVLRPVADEAAPAGDPGAAGAPANGSAPAPVPPGTGEGQLFEVAPAPSAAGAPGEARQAAGERRSRGGRAGAAAEGAAQGRRARAGEERGEAVGEAHELSLEELVRAAGVDVAMVQELERFGLVTPRTRGGIAYYGAEAEVIARVAAGFARHGVEARHLRAYKGAAEREAGLVQQVVMPLVRQRNPEARQAARAAVEELSQLGGELRAALLSAALGELR